MPKKGTKSPANALSSHGFSGLYGFGPEGEAAWKSDIERVREMRSRLPKRTLKP